MRLWWRTPRVDSLKLVELAYTRIENAHKEGYARTLSLLFMWLLYVQLLGEQNRYAFVWAVMINPPRTVARKCSLMDLYVCAGRLDIEHLLKSPLIFLYFNLGALWLCLEGRSPPKHPRGDRSESAWTANYSDEAWNDASIGMKLH